MSQYTAVAQVPEGSITFVTGQEMMAGRGNFTAVIDGLKSLRKQGILVANVRKDKPIPGRTPASMQVWLLHPSQICTPQVFVSAITVILLCIRALQRPCHHAIWSAALDSSCPACIHYLSLSASALAAMFKIAYCKTTTLNFNGAQLPTCNLHTLLPAQITLCQPAAHLLLHTRRPAFKNSTSQLYHHVGLFGKHMHMSVMCFV